MMLPGEPVTADAKTKTRMSHKPDIHIYKKTTEGGMLILVPACSGGEHTIHENPTYRLFQIQG